MLMSRVLATISAVGMHVVMNFLENKYFMFRV